MKLTNNQILALENDLFNLGLSEQELSSSTPVLDTFKREASEFKRQWSPVLRRIQQYEKGDAEFLGFMDGDKVDTSLKNQRCKVWLYGGIHLVLTFSPKQFYHFGQYKSLTKKEKAIQDLAMQLGVSYDKARKEYNNSLARARYAKKTKSRSSSEIFNELFNTNIKPKKKGGKKK